LEKEQLKHEREQLEQLVAEEKRKETEAMSQKKALQREYKASLIEQMEQLDLIKQEQNEFKMIMDMRVKVFYSSHLFSSRVIICL
jgi:hypothetical protein